MRIPEVYLNKVNSLTLRSELYEIGVQMQKDAWNDAIDASKEPIARFLYARDYRISEIQKALDKLKK